MAKNTQKHIWLKDKIAPTINVTLPTTAYEVAGKN